jgi:arabinofuranan 3-O-arabinosyltransferase
MKQISATMSDSAEIGKGPVSFHLDVLGLATAAACGLAVAYPACLELMFRSHDWILGRAGRPSITDFLVFWLAGHSALNGAAAAAYVPQLHHAAEVAATGHAFAGQLPWRNSPVFFFVAAGLALLPYFWAFLLWVTGTLAIYSLVISRISGSRLALVLACATPAVFINAICGQNGALTAALFGASLWTLERRPVVSGILIGLLSYKPQFGILFPLVLFAGGHWKALASAAMSCAAAMAASALVFGIGTWRAFLHYLPITSNEILVRGINGFNKLQTAYGLMRWLGFGNDAAWAVQAGLICFIAAAMFWLWRRELSFTLKAAALPVATLLVTPHLFMYDFPLLAISFAFLFRDRSFDRTEFACVGLANLCMGAFLFIPAPIGLIALAISLALIIRRIPQESVCVSPAPPILKAAS